MAATSDIRQVATELQDQLSSHGKPSNGKPSKSQCKDSADAAERTPSPAELALIFKQLADTNRLRILMELVRRRECNVSELCEHLGHSQPLVSHHLALLRMAELVQVRKAGKHHFYSIRGERFQFLVDQLFRQVWPEELGE